MMKTGRSILSTIWVVAAFAVTMFIVHSCGIYSFTGTSIQPDVKSITINYFDYQALKVNPSLSNDLTVALQDKFLKLTKLEQVDMDGDLEIAGAVTGYDVKATAITAIRGEVSPVFGEVCTESKMVSAITMEYSDAWVNARWAIPCSLISSAPMNCI